MHRRKYPPDAAAQPRSSSTGDQRGAFFNSEDAQTVDAFAERLMPGAPGKPGARDAGVLNYIDLALAGAYSDQQDFYRRGLASLDAYCVATHNAPFVKLDATRQDAVIKAVEDNKATGFTWPSAAAFFNTLRTHTMEGIFADPVYGGNKDFAGWRLVGLPSTQGLCIIDAILPLNADRPAGRPWHPDPREYWFYARHIPRQAEST